MAMPIQSEKLDSAAGADGEVLSPEDDRGTVRPEADGLDGGDDEKSERLTYSKLISAGFGFFVAGVNDGSMGALVPYFIRDYHVNSALVSVIYGANFLGWFASALTNTHLCEAFDLGAMLLIGAAIQLISHALRCWMAPFPLLVATFWLTSLGQALQDTQTNSYVAGAENSHRWLGFIHAMYAAGCLCGPFIATAIATAHVPSQWYLFYLCPVGLCVVNLVALYIAFRERVLVKRRRRRAENANVVEGQTEVRSVANVASRSQSASKLIQETFSLPSFWLLSLFFFFYIGAVLTATSWLVEYLVDVRHGDLAKMGYVPVGYNGGTFVGRVFLVEPAHKFGPRRMILLYCILAIAFQLVFWLVPNIIAEAIAASFIGLFTGPNFATGVNLGSKLFPARVRSTALGFVFVSAQMGGCVFPIVTGVIAAHAGVKVLQPILCALLVTMTIAWVLVPQPKKQAGSSLGLADDNRSIP